jgi:hypothetical protein
VSRQRCRSLHLDGFIGQGSIVFDRLGTKPGDAITGHFDGQFVALPAELAKQLGGQ